MAFEIPIWPGSSSFTTGSTPFGFYDNDNEFTSSIDNVALWCSRRLGYPIVDIELQDINFYAAFEEAITEYAAVINQFNMRENMLNLVGSVTGSNLTQREITPNLGKIIKLATSYGTEAGSGGDVTWHRGSIAVTGSIQNYDLNTWAAINVPSESIEIKRIFHHEPPIIAQYGLNPNFGAYDITQEFGWSGWGPNSQYILFPAYEDVLRIQAIEFAKQIRRSAYSFELKNNQLRLFPIPENDTTLYFEYILKSDRDNPLKTDDNLISDISNAPYQNMVYSKINDVGKQWIKKYTLVITKEMLGQVRSKYASMPFPGNEITLNGPELLAQAQNERELLLTELKETLEAVNRSKQMLQQKEEAEYLQETLNRVPLGIYIR